MDYAKQKGENMAGSSRDSETRRVERWRFVLKPGLCLNKESDNSGVAVNERASAETRRLEELLFGRFGGLVSDFES